MLIYQYLIKQSINLSLFEHNLQYSSINVNTFSYYIIINHNNLTNGIVIEYFQSESNFMVEIEFVYKLLIILLLIRCTAQKPTFLIYHP